MEHPGKPRATTATAATLVRARGVRAGYAGRGEVLRGFDLEVCSGQICALLGPNGAGKSTVVRVLAGLLTPAAGEVELFGRPLASYDRREIAMRVAVVHQSTARTVMGGEGGFSVREVVMMGRAPHQSSWMRASAEDRRIVEQALETCRLGEIADRTVETLSGGEEQRVMMARALTQRGDVLLLDEPGAHLDARATIELFEVVRREVSERGLACVAVLHDLALAAHFADHVLLFKDGRTVASGAPAEIMSPEILGDAFDVELATGIDAASSRRYFLPIRAR